MINTYSALASFSNVKKKDTVLSLKPGHFGVRDLTSPWCKKSDREKMKDDRIVMFESLGDLAVLSMIPGKSLLAEDELIRGIREMGPGKPVPTWLVFAMQCFLDAQHILQNRIQKPFSELELAASTIKESILETLKFTKSSGSATGPYRMTSFSRSS